MSIMETIRSSVSRESNHDEYRISLESPSVEWMRYMRQLRDQTLHADIAIETNKSDAAIEMYVETVGSIDYELGRLADITATYVKKHGERQYDNKGRATDGSTDVLTPLEISVVDDAVTTFEHLRTENSQALVEALLLKYSNELAWPMVVNIRERYNALSGKVSETVS